MLTLFFQLMDHICNTSVSSAGVHTLFGTLRSAAAREGRFRPTPMTLGFFKGRLLTSGAEGAYAHSWERWDGPLVPGEFTPRVSRPRPSPCVPRVGQRVRGSEMHAFVFLNE